DAARLSTPHARGFASANAGWLPTSNTARLAAPDTRRLPAPDTRRLPAADTVRLSTPDARGFASANAVWFPAANAVWLSTTGVLDILLRASEGLLRRLQPLLRVLERLLKSGLCRGRGRFQQFSQRVDVLLVSLFELLQRVGQRLLGADRLLRCGGASREAKTGDCRGNVERETTHRKHLLVLGGSTELPQP
ncbi:MAG: hypothetical protein WED34_14160, partial [Planctomycetales bacterium]